MSAKLTKFDLVIVILTLPLVVYFHDDIKRLLLWIAVLWPPLSACVYLLRWYLQR